MAESDCVSKAVREFIFGNFLYGQERPLGDKDSFLNEGILESTGVLELVNFVEEKYGISVEEDELTPDNFDSINNVTVFINRKLGGPDSSVIDKVTPAGGNV